MKKIISTIMELVGFVISIIGFAQLYCYFGIKGWVYGLIASTGACIYVNFFYIKRY